MKAEVHDSLASSLRLVVWLSCACGLLLSVDAAAQQLLDRILARVNGFEITYTDLLAARGFGVVTGATEDAALQRMIERQLQLNEVARFPPPEPSEAAVDAEVTRERNVAGARMREIMETSGTNDARIREMARDTLRIEAYIDQRFGTGLQVTDDEAAAYYGAHPDEFRRNGTVIPFDEALPTARERANAERRQQQVERWLIDLRGRADIVVPRAG